MLTEFCRTENVYRVRDVWGNPLQEVGEMLLAADPVHGGAASFDEEREIRKHIGDYALFLTGMYPGSIERRQGPEGSYSRWSGRARRVTTSFPSSTSSNTREAAFFARLASSFEACIYGLNLVRGELDGLKAAAPPGGGTHPPKLLN